MKTGFIDSITHIVLGACIGEAALGRQLGKKAMLFGAVAQSIPDLDFLVALWTDEAGTLMAHRGFTHSILFALLFSALLALAFWRLQRGVGLFKWLFFFSAQLAAHLLLDMFNNYGTGLLIPFDATRYSFNALYVADPLFSLWPLLACIALVILPYGSRKRLAWVRFGITGSIIYLCLSAYNKINIVSDVKYALKEQRIHYNDFLTTPSPFNTWLWFVAVKTDSGFHVGYRSAFDTAPEMDLRYFPRNDSLLSLVRDQEEVEELKRFSQGYYTIERWHDTLVFNDLRFGQVIGWHDPAQKFAFHFYLDHPEKSNRAVVQRGRFMKWDREARRSLWRRISGN